jgi:hypothetical protein
VDNQYIGDGSVSYDTGQIGQWGGSKEFLVTIKHPEYTTLNKIIENKFDISYGASVGVLGLGLGGLLAIQGSNETLPSLQASDYIVAGLEVTLAAIGVLDSYKFKKTYYFTLTENNSSSSTQ